MTGKSGRAKRKANVARFLTRDELEIDAIACELQNLGGTCAENTQHSDVEWFGRWLYHASNFGFGDYRMFCWSLSNEEFDAVNLLPDRIWTRYRWETLPNQYKDAWLKLARLCLHALPHIAERIGHRMLAQSKALRIHQSASTKALKAIMDNGDED